jgi:predicted phosphodiesterase
MGNHEEALLKPQEREDLSSNKGLTKRLLSKENLDFLVNLPRQMTLSYANSYGKFNLLLVHGSAKSATDYMVEDYPENEVLDMMRQHKADILLCGHTHKPFHRVIKSGDRYKHVINIGSVGKPKDGDRRLCYALIEFNQSLNSHNSDSLKVNFRRIEYDIEKAARAVEVSAFDKALRTGK